MHEHKCEEKPEQYIMLIYDENVRFASLENIYNDEFIENIKFCPWCGAKLEDEK